MDALSDTTIAQERWARWLLADRFGTDPEIRRSVNDSLNQWADRILARAAIAAGDVVLDVGTGDGLLGLRALQAVGPTGKVIFNDISQTLLSQCRTNADRTQDLERCDFLHASVENLAPLARESINVVTTRSVLMHIQARATALNEIYRVLAPGGRLSLFEAIHQLSNPSPQTSFWGYDLSDLTQELPFLPKLLSDSQPGPSDPMVNFDERDLIIYAEHAGFNEIDAELHSRSLRPSPMRNWDFFFNTSRHPAYPTLRDAAADLLTPQQNLKLTALLQPFVEQGRGTQRQTVLFLTAHKSSENHA